MNILRHCYLPWAAAFAALLIPASSAPAQCPAPAAWFPHQNTPAPDFNKSFTSNCDFHQWGWQTFLWLTQDTGGGRIRLMDMPTADQLFMPGRAPSPLNAKALEGLKKRPLLLMPRVGKKEDPTTFDEVEQAGSGGLLVDKNGRPVYYISHINDVYYNFVRDNKLFIKENYVAASPTLNFPVGSLEIKSSWRIVAEGESTAGFFTAPAMIHPLTCSASGNTCTNDDIIVDRTKVENVTVALVGIHVVGVVKDHPEFIWSTFEHVKNAPTLPTGMQPDSNQPVSDKDWNFYTANTPASACNRLPVTLTLDTQASKLSPITNAFLQFVLGGGSQQDTTNIQTLNASVLSQLEADSVWKNYLLGGGVWFKQANALAPTLTSQQIQALTTGSTQLSNVTMETFTQGVGQNCFSCHQVRGRGGMPNMNLNISHILKNGLIQRNDVQQKLLAKQKLRLAANEVTTLKMAPLNSYADVQALLDTFVANNNVPINLAPHRAFWKTMTYQEFITGNIPRVEDPDTGNPLKVLVVNDSKNSNLIMSLSGTPGTIFDPNTGSIGQMPPSGPFMDPADIARIADWIDRGCPNN